MTATPANPGEPMPTTQPSPEPDADLLKLLVTACTHAERDMRVIIPIVESGAGMSASSLRNTLGLINKALVAHRKAAGPQEKTR